MPTRAFYAGSFDPLTHGHLHIIQKAAVMFDRVVVGIGVNPKKPGLFTADERQQILGQEVAKLKNVDVVVYRGLTVAAAKAHRCSVLVRGLRDIQDFGSEMQMAFMNQHLESKIQTVFIPTLQVYAAVSASLLKEVASMGGDVSGFVSKHVERALRSKFASSRPNASKRSATR